MRTAREVLSADPSLEALFAEMRTAEEARAPLGCTAAAASLFAVLLLFGSCSALFDKSGAIAAIVPAVAGIGLAIFAVTRLFRLSTQSDRAVACFGRFVRRTVELALDEGQYLPGAGIPESVILASVLYPPGDEYDSGDLVGGKEGSTSFHFARVLSENVEIETDSDGNETENRTTVFSGVWFIADFNKHFHSRTRVVPDTAERLFGKRLGRWMQNAGNRGKLVELESPEFERMFAVYSDSQQDARYVLSPALMDRLTQLGRKHRGLRTAFHDGCIALALPDAPAYLRKTSASTAEALAAALLRSIAPYVSLVSALDLNTRIWTKE